MERTKNNTFDRADKCIAKLKGIASIQAGDKWSTSHAAPQKSGIITTLTRTFWTFGEDRKLNLADIDDTIDNAFTILEDIYTFLVHSENMDITHTRKYQKGTGRARHGSITGPIFVGGGIVHGPKPRDFELKMPKKMKIQALVSALTEKNKDSKIFVFDGKLTGKTKQFALMVKNIIGAEKKKNPSVLFIRSKADKQAYLASKNVKKIATVEGSGVNTYEVIKNTAVLISKDAIDEMKQVFVKA